MLADLSLDELYRELTRDGLARRLFALAREEDLGPDSVDVTAWATLDGDQGASAALRAREGGIAAGLACLPELAAVFAQGEAPVEIETRCADGDRIEPGQTLAMLTGSTRAVVRLERTMLNVISRLSGVATRTGEFAACIPPDTHARLYDTRKTTPGWRALEKYAVRCGGGRTHRLGLYDAVLVKDNHLASAPLDALGERLTQSLRRSRAASELRFVEVEVDSLEQLEVVLGIEPGLIDVVMLDNFSIERLERGVAMRDALAAGVALEASGGVTLETIAPIARTGVERISVGSLTHHAVSLDLGLDIEPGR